MNVTYLFYFLSRDIFTEGVHTTHHSIGSNTLESHMSQLEEKGCLGLRRDICEVNIVELFAWCIDSVLNEPRWLDGVVQYLHLLLFVKK